MSKHPPTPLRTLIDWIQLALPVLLLAIGSGWIGEGIHWPPALAGTLLFIAGAAWLYRLRHRYLPARVLTQSPRIEPHRALIIPISLLNAPEEDLDTLPQDLYEAVQDRRWS